MCTLTSSRNYTVKCRLLNPLKELVTSSLQQIWNEFRSNESCYVKFSRTEKMLDSFTRIGVKIWNSISPSIKLFSRTKCRKVIKSSLLEDFLQSEDDYVKVPGLIELFSSLSSLRYLHTELFSSITIIFLRILFLLFIYSVFFS